jgi:hypothetical protein
MQGEANRCFIVPSLRPAGAAGRSLYETVYCAQGEMENRIKECPVKQHPAANGSGWRTPDASRQLICLLTCVLKRFPILLFLGGPLVGQLQPPSPLVTFHGA